MSLEKNKNKINSEEKVRKTGLISTKEEQLVNEQTEEKDGKIEKNWCLEIINDIENIEDIEPSSYSLGEEGLITHFRIKRLDGTLEEIESSRIILKIKNKNKVNIEVSVLALYHIKSLHQKGEEAGSVFFKINSLKDLFEIITRYLPSEIPFKDKVAAFEVDVKQPIGTEGVSSQEEMLEKGIATEKDLAMLSAVKDKVFRLNIEGTNKEKEKFVDEFNIKMNGNVKLGIRSNAIVPFFIAKQQPTTKIFLVIGKELDSDGFEHNRLWTMAPGRYMERLPTDKKYAGQLFDGNNSKEEIIVAKLLKKSRLGEELSLEEKALIEEQRRSQECWWNNGFIISKERN